MTLALLLLPLAAPPGPTDLGPMRVTIELAPDPPRLGRPLELSVTVSGPARYAFTWPSWKAGTQGGTVRVLEVRRDGPDRMEGKFGPVAVERWAVRLEPLHDGPIDWPPAMVSWKGDGETGNGRLPLPATAVIDDGPPGPGLLPIPEPPDSAGGEGDRAGRVAWLLKMAGLAALMALGLIWLWPGGKSPTPPAPATAPVEAELDDLTAAEPSRAGVERMVAMLRAALQRRLPDADRMTAAELAARTGDLGLSEGGREEVTELLALSDPARFAADPPTAAEYRQAGRLLRTLLAELRRPPAP